MNDMQKIENMKTLYELHKGNKIAVLDMDEIIVDITPKWKDLIVANKDTLQPFCSREINDDITDYDILNRKEYYVNNYFGADEIGKELIQHLYTTETFYDDLEPTRFITKGILPMLKNEKLGFVIVLTKSFECHLEGKKRCIERIFKEYSDKVLFLPVGVNEKKSDVLKKYNLTVFDLVADDLIENINDIVNSFQLPYPEVFIPKLGYNREGLKIDNAMCTVNYYEVEAGIK